MTTEEFDDLIVKILDEVKIEDVDPIFTEEGIKMIALAAEYARETKIYVNNREKEPEGWKKASAEELYTNMLYKIVDAPTRLHQVATTRMMLPAIDEELRRKPHKYSEGGGIDK